MPADERVFAITAPTVFNGEQFLRDHCVVVQGQTVSHLIPAGDSPAGIPTVTLASGILAPGLIDLQVNGGGGILLNNRPTAATIRAMRAAHLSGGTTAMLPTFMSDTPEKQRAAIDAVREVRAEGDEGVLGIHIEGPFFNPVKHGAHQAQLIRSPRAEDIDLLCSLNDLCVLLTLAPETLLSADLKRLTASGIHVCAGHTNANHQQLKDAADAGLRGVTHLFNAMRQAGAREPGTVGATLDEDRLWAGIIADGHHVHPASIRLAYKAKPPGKLILVSDSMALVGSTQTSFELYGELIRVEGGKLVNSDGVLAGSAINLMQAVQYATDTAGLPLEACLRMASLYPATALGIDHLLGRIAPGYRADLVHFDSRYKVHNTWQSGLQQQRSQ